METNAVREKKITKTAVAAKLGISRGMLYYRHKQPQIDEEVRRQLNYHALTDVDSGKVQAALVLCLLSPDS